MSSRNRDHALPASRPCGRPAPLPVRRHRSAETRRNRRRQGRHQFRRGRPRPADARVHHPHPANHRYPHDVGSMDYRRQISAFFQRRYGVSLDPEREVLTLIGSKEGIGHLALAVVNPGDVVLVPDPGYPVYASGTLFAGGTSYSMPLREERGFLPDLDAIPSDVAKKAVLMHINYPNNPTGAVASRDFFANVVAFAKQHDLIVSQDAAYNEMYFDESDRAPSILEIPGARDVAIEMHSLSKTFNMTGWRLGFAVGKADVLSALARIKANLDSGQFTAIQEAGAEAYEGIDRPEIHAARQTYAERARTMAAGLRDLGFRVATPRATFYVWAGTPRGLSATEVVTRLIDEAA
ncbi:MAG: aminotransferase class I/II-fold pyridoxal phosphate-dependent enzyme, partial [Planctomycetes bacterium]|nr:aminotransferase class I/II-fold pyridoxal phosphate-dependent enzyme [Planctomycetota bacterium]